MSTRVRPKQLLTLEGDCTLVADTFRRIEPLVEPADTLVMTGESLAASIASELPGVPSERIVGEPVGRNTAPAIALAARVLSLQDPDAVMVVLPADHLIADEDSFRSTIGLAVRAAVEKGALVTLGIRPTRPETEYGYIRAAGPSAMDGVLRVDSFTEKPDADTADEYLRSGDYYWNSGMFVWRAGRYLEELERHLPDTSAAARSVTALPGQPEFSEQLAAFYSSVEGISVDYGIMEKTDAVVVVPSDFGWDDVGAWPALSRVWGTDERGNTERGDTVVLDSSDSVVFAEEGTVAVLGVKGLVVVRTAEATMVCPVERAREVRDIVRRLKERSQG